MATVRAANCVGYASAGAYNSVNTPSISPVIQSITSSMDAGASSGLQSVQVYQADLELLYSLHTGK